MNRLSATYPWNPHVNMLLLAYVTWMGVKIFTMKLHGWCVRWAEEIPFQHQEMMSALFILENLKTWKHIITILNSLMLMKVSIHRMINSQVHIKKIHLQGVSKKTPVYVYRLITPVWKQLLGHVGTFLDSSGSQLSFEPKKSRILYMDLWENHVWRELPYHDNKGLEG